MAKRRHTIGPVVYGLPMTRDLVYIPEQEHDAPDGAVVQLEDLKHMRVCGHHLHGLVARDDDLGKAARQLEDLARAVDRAWHEYCEQLAIDCSKNGERLVVDYADGYMRTEVNDGTV
jgi:hypothetical protein